jgi:hypothetical protein
MQDRNYSAFKLMCACTSTLVMLLVAFSQSASSQSTGYQDGLSFFKNYFVTGDYAVAGVGLRGTGDASGLATGYINMTGVPNGAIVISAFLYWETIESTPLPSSGDGFFQGYPILGKSVGTGSSPCWSAGGGTGSSNGSKTLRVYRADVAPNLVINGAFQTNGTYQVILHDSGSNGAGTPLTEGASLLIIYRTLNAPLKSVVIYDGSWTMNNSTSYMSQTLKGFYQADDSIPSSGRLTHIVGDGQSNFGETLYFNGNQIAINPFTGTSGFSWDNITYNVDVPDNSAVATTMVLPNAATLDCLSWGAVVFSTPVKDRDGDGLLDTWETNQGYWDVKDGTWVALPGADPDVKDLFVQIDYLNNTGTKSGPMHSHLPRKDALDQIGSAFTRSKAGNGTGSGIKVHFDVGNNYQVNPPDPYIVPSASFIPPGGTTAVSAAKGGNSIDEDAISCTDGTTTLCQFPYPAIPVPGIVSWKAGVTLAKNQYFQHARKDTHRYVLVGHALGLANSNWSLADQSLVSIRVNPQQVATITTAGSNGLTGGSRVTISGAVSDYNLNGTYDVTSTSPSTNSFTVNTKNVAVGTYSAVVFGSFPSLKSGTYTGIGVGLDATGTIKEANEPNLLVSSGSPKSTSGFSDLGGGDSLVTLGLWRADDPPICSTSTSTSCCVPNPAQGLISGQSYCTDQVGNATVQAGTIMHEMGHPLFLTHGGYYPNWQGGGPAFGQNCKPNFLSVMNYLFQIRGLPDPAGAVDPATGDVAAYVDYSGQTFTDLNENVLTESNGLGMGTALDGTVAVPSYGTRWYAPPNYLDTIIQNTTGGHYAAHHCDGSLPASNESPVVKVGGNTVLSGAPAAIDWNNNGIFTDTVKFEDVNFDGTNSDAFLTGVNDWTSLNLRQIGARRNFAGFSVDIQASDVVGGGAQTLGGGAQTLGGGAQTLGGGSDLINAGAQTLGGGAQTLGGGAQTLGGGAQTLGGGLEVDFDQANSVVDAPVGLTAKTGAKSIILNWHPPRFGQIETYYVWRVDITKLPMSPTNPPTRVKTLTGASFATTWTDTNVKTNATYEYFVTAALGSKSGSNSGNQSGPSNLVTITAK